jgi:branched-chain amino acid transport system permease protein
VSGNGSRAAGGRLRVLALLLAFSALVSLPLWVSGVFYVNITSQILIYAVFALGLNVLVGYAGLVSLGHAGIFGIAAYATAIALGAGFGHAGAIAFALAVTLAGTAVFAALALRATGIVFIMITLALGQILWGLAYRWISLTSGDNGLNVTSRPAPFGFDLSDPNAFYYATLCVFALAVLAAAVFIDSAFGASLKGTRDQPRRMNALGYHVWLIRFYACLFSGFLTGIAGILFVYYNQFISPQTLALTSSAEVLLMVISGGSGTLLGPIAGAALVVAVKNLASAYIERWNMLLGAIFVAIVVFMPEGLVPGSARLARWALKALRPPPAPAARGKTP